MIDSNALDSLFRTARTHSGWLDSPVTDAQLMALYDLMKMAPTSMNCSPARIVFVRSSDAKARLKPHLSAGNVDKTMAAPVTAIIGYDVQFQDYLPKLFPHAPQARANFDGEEKRAAREMTAFRNGTLQGGYFILAARAVGLDCGPMSGFNNAGVDAAFFPNSTFKSNFLCNLGHGDTSKLQPRSPRFDFAEVCKIV